MEDARKEQLEALEVLAEFNERLVKNMNIIVKELSGERLDDTDKFLKSIVDAINWEIQVVNGTMEVLNDGKEKEVVVKRYKQPNFIQKIGYSFFRSTKVFPCPFRMQHLSPSSLSIE